MTITVDIDIFKKRIEKVKLRLMMTPSSTFFANLLGMMRLNYTDTVPTAGVDGITLYINPTWADTLADDELFGLLMHETCHLAFDHIVRCTGAGLDKKLYNVAADHLINLFLIEHGYSLPPGGLCDPRFKGMSTGAIYNVLKGEQKKIPSGFMLDLLNPGNGDEELSETNAVLVQGIVLSAAMQTEIQGDAGSIPGEVARQCLKLTEPTLPWNQILLDYMTAYNKDDTSWQRPNRRYLPDFHLPTKIGEAVDQISIAYDVSGSISKQDFTEIMSEVRYIWDTVQPTKLRIMAFDTRISSDITLNQGDDMEDIELTGGGGTNLKPVFKTLEKDQPAVCLIFTDGYVEVPKADKIESDLIWIIKDNPSWKTDTGRVIHMDTTDV